mmetsp:Transcript_19860/g.32652  ORF Transcript_19860/g.32652 Transcript_19860/m.32652 type:complete len:357 (+) Transcript_19860:2147-3217(+)|eukprot:CAMPEP_0203757460 /NCGR_PEP_ID=MMETSP0098-20131031/10513_1 /ASSEMBLY_ACC=CAM_ASM_000208 /TAXON_ID=96639 /ORGANISM=" , Strain NY0313808BC1" /LENGTH=356 /DNA_ID=CAMNT_0050649673 /DNA_START=2129 /DNA_END=3199 /DNA_ORIENTATION=-
MRFKVIVVIVVAIILASKYEHRLCWQENALVAVLSFTELFLQEFVNPHRHTNVSDVPGFQATREMFHVAYGISWIYQQTVLPELHGDDYKLEEINYPRRDKTMGRILMFYNKKLHRKGSSERALVYFHGGGMTTGWADNSFMRLTALNLGVVILSVDYRLAPEYTFPTPVEDSFDGFMFIHQQAARLGLDPSRLSLGGESAGGLLTAAVSRMAEQAKVSPPIHLQVLLQPCLAFPANFPSWVEFACYGTLSSHAMTMFWRVYTHNLDFENEPMACYKDPRCSPLSSTEHYKNLPRTVVVTGLCDILRDEGRLYAKKVREQGTDVDLIELPSTHAGALFFQQDPHLRDAFAKIKALL